MEFSSPSILSENDSLTEGRVIVSPSEMSCIILFSSSETVESEFAPLSKSVHPSFKELIALSKASFASPNSKELSKRSTTSCISPKAMDKFRNASLK